jgi:peptidyl-dipeptidase A
MITQPFESGEADWASKIHIATSPCYYHNYLLGEITASQLHYYIVGHVLKSENFQANSYSHKKEVGAWLIQYIFKPGSRYNWQQLIKSATGEELTAKYYASQFVGK